MLFGLLLVFAGLSHFFYSGYKLKKDLHIFQLNSYRFSRYGKWLLQKWRLAFAPLEILILLLVFLTTLFVVSSLVLAVFIIFYDALFLWHFIKDKKRGQKKPLHFTARAKRLYGAALALLVLFYVVAGFLLHANNGNFNLLLASALAITFFSPFLLMLAALLLLPVETAINNYYLRDARKILDSIPNLLIIGITGSFGKTSTKEILYEFLRHRFNTLATPGSYNTPLGICKVIRSDLKPTHEIFIVEMSAKEPGDIKEICNFVRPKFGVITVIGEQHLETFKNIATIKKTKNELIAALPNDGLAFFNYDSEYCRDLARHTVIETVLFGFDNSEQNLKYFADDVLVNESGTAFTLHQASGLATHLHSVLLGKHNVANILAAAAVALELGVTAQELMRATKLLKPVEHRLELKNIGGGVSVIDDAFNSNSVGSQMALDVLAQISGNKKIIVTPGMIELGAKEYELNKKFGVAIAAVCDYVILVGAKQTQAVQDGLQTVNFAPEKIFVAKNFAEAKAHLQKIAAPGAVILFENDLPDNYDES